MALSRAALLLVAAAALVACALAQTNGTDSTYVPSACNNLAQWPTPRPEAPNWSNAVAQLKSEVVAADQPGQGYELLLYGASIFENWRGTAVGITWRNSEGIVEAYNNTFPNHYRTDVLAISGDDEGNLLWRLQNGELYQRNPPKVAVLELTGNNDLSDADCRFNKADIDAVVPGTIQRTKEVVSMLRWGGRNSVRVVLLLLTPRGGAYWAHPEEGLASFWPNRYTDAINRVNAGLRELAANDPYVTTQDCGYIWYNATGLRTPDMVTDGMHPTLLGTQEFTRCVARAVDPLMAARGTPEPWQDSGLESLYAGLPFWVNASANYNSTARSDTAQVARANSYASGDDLYGAGPAPAPAPESGSLRRSRLLA